MSSSQTAAASAPVLKSPKMEDAAFTAAPEMPAAPEACHISTAAPKLSLLLTLALASKQASAFERDKTQSTACWDELG